MKKIISYIGKGMLIFAGLMIVGGGVYVVGKALMKAEIRETIFGTKNAATLKIQLDGGEFLELQISPFGVEDADLSGGDFVENHQVVMRSEAPITSYNLQAVNVVRTKQDVPFVPVTGVEDPCFYVHFQVDTGTIISVRDLELADPPNNYPFIDANGDLESQLINWKFTLISSIMDEPSLESGNVTCEFDLVALEPG